MSGTGILGRATARRWATTAAAGRTGNFCRAGWYCLDAYGRPHQYMYQNGFLSAEDQTQSPVRLTSPDWFPIEPPFDTGVLTTQLTCTSGGCTHAGINLEIPTTPAPPIVPGAYQAVYSANGQQIAYVRNVRGTPEIFIGNHSSEPDGTRLTAGSQPDWQPLI